MTFFLHFPTHISKFYVPAKFHTHTTFFGFNNCCSSSDVRLPEINYRYALQYFTKAGKVNLCQREYGTMHTTIKIYYWAIICLARGEGNLLYSTNGDMARNRV